MSTKTKVIIGIVAVLAIGGTVGYIGYTKGWFGNKPTTTTA